MKINEFTIRMIGLDDEEPDIYNTDTPMYVRDHDLVLHQITNVVIEDNDTGGLRVVIELGKEDETDSVGY